MTTELKHTVNLVVGDWSDDGHGHTDTVTIKTNFTGAEVEIAYKIGVQVIGFDLSKEVAADYEDRSISPEFVQKLIAAGIDPNEIFEEGVEDDGGAKFWGESYAIAYLFFVKAGNSDFVYEIINNPDTTINIGGYGLFE